MESDSSPSEGCLSSEHQISRATLLDCQVQCSQVLQPPPLSLSTCDHSSDIAAMDQQPTSRKQEPLKARLIKLKNKLSAVCIKHEQMPLCRQLTTTYKSRLMKLSIEMEKHVNSQLHNLQQLESTLRELGRVVEQRQDNDLQVLRQTRFIPSLMEFFKRVISSHRNQYKESHRVLDVATKLLVVFCTIRANREYLILTGRFQTLASLFSWTLSKKEELGEVRIIANLSTVLCYLLEHRFEGDSTRILEISIEIIFLSQLLRRIKGALEGSVGEDGLSDEPIVKSLMRFLMCLLVQADPRCEMKPVYEEPTDNPGCNANLEWIVTVINQLISCVLIDRESGKRETGLGASHLAIILYGIRLLNICCRLNLSLMQKLVSAETIVLLSHVVGYSNMNYDSGTDVKQLLNESIVLLGYLSLDNPIVQSKAHQSGLLGEICNLPTKFIIEKSLVEILMPTICCLIHKNQRNLHAIFDEMSSLHMKKFLQTEMKTRQNVSCEGSGMHSRKLSLSSSNSAITQCSSINLSVTLGHSPYSLKMRFPRNQWSELYDQLERIE